MSFAKLLKDIEKKFSEDNPDLVFDSSKKYEAIPSGNFAFDLCSGIGGFPRGRITEVIAMESTGKSSLLYATIANLQRNGGVSVLFDFEQSFDAYYMKSYYGGEVNETNFLLFRPTNIEEGDAIFELLMKSGEKIDLLVFDSVECMKPKAMIEATLNDTTRIGAQAQAISKFLHRLKTYAFKNNFAVVLLNQVRHQIAQNAYISMKGIAAGYDPKGQYTTPGGMAPRFLASMRFELKPAGKEEGTGKVDALSEELGLEKSTKLINVVNAKNKCARPDLKCITHFDHKTQEQPGGWNRTKDILRLLKKIGRVKQSGTKFTYKGLNEEWENIGSKVESEKEFGTNEKLMKDAEALIRSFLVSPNPDLVLDRAGDEDLTPGIKEGQDDGDFDIVQAKC